ncbi:DUF4365 domain-containing protein [Streptomyces sp. GMY02]|uniref:DUF4365 domain-containing protein n=1 Tax=Streptomyces sp. GMY02 TaxID=1333528 RepID=UPI001C2BEC12|nr:DUF4365 domain-containing protein [Streptomyces sp. GMY02]QXE35907.1 DUF4365 domain-containing protein [Streptomyces sp. GMY02]
MRATEPAEGRKPRASHIEAVDMRHVTQMMEQLQQGYIKSVAATAGMVVEVVPVDVYGYDVRLIRPSSDPRIDESAVLAQLKCTTQIVPDQSREHFSYQFTKRQYFDHLARSRRYPKAILIVMTVPPRQAEWTEVTHDGLWTRRSCFWVSLEGVEIDPSVKKPTVHIPTKNRVDAESLSEILDKIDRGEPLNE